MAAKDMLWRRNMSLVSGCRALCRTEDSWCYVLLYSYLYGHLSQHNVHDLPLLLYLAYLAQTRYYGPLRPSPLQQDAEYVAYALRKL